MVLSERFTLTSEDLMCLAALCGYETMINIDYEPEESEGDPNERFNIICDQFRKEGWLQEDFDGNKTLNKKLAAVGVLASCADRYWLAQIHTDAKKGEEMVANIYYDQGMALLLEQREPQVYEGYLYKGTDFCPDFLLSKFEVPDATPADSKILSTDEVLQLAKQEEKQVMNISRYFFRDEEIVCEDTVSYLLLEKTGAYYMETSDDGELFQPLDIHKFKADMQRVFEVEAK